MRMKQIISVSILLLFLVGSVCPEEANFTARVTDRENNEFLLTNFKRYRYDNFQCRIRDHTFKLGFGNIRNIDFIGMPDTPVQGYTQADLQLANGSRSNIYISSSSVTVGGLDRNLNIVIRLPLEDVKTIAFITNSAEQ